MRRLGGSLSLEDSVAGSRFHIRLKICAWARTLVPVRRQSGGGRADYLATLGEI